MAFSDLLSGFELFTSGGVLYRINESGATFESYDPATNTWSATTSIATSSGQYEYFFENGTAYRVDTTANPPTQESLGSSGWSTVIAGASSVDIDGAITGDWNAGSTITSHNKGRFKELNGYLVYFPLNNDGRAPSFYASPNGTGWSQFSVSGVNVGGVAVGNNPFGQSFAGVSDITWDGTRYIGVFVNVLSGAPSGFVLWSDNLFSWYFPPNNTSGAAMVPSPQGGSKFEINYNGGNTVLAYTNSSSQGEVIHSSTSFAEVDSADIGLTLSTFAAGSSNAASLAFLNNMWVVVTDNGVYNSTDGGLTWALKVGFSASGNTRSIMYDGTFWFLHQSGTVNHMFSSDNLTSLTKVALGIEFSGTFVDGSQMYASGTDSNVYTISGGGFATSIATGPVERGLTKFNGRWIVSESTQLSYL